VGFVALLVLGAGLAACSCGSRLAGGTSSTVSSTAADTAHASIGDLTLTGGYIPQPASPDVAAAYITITNNGTKPDTITKVTTSVTTNVMAMTETSSGGVGSMTDLPAVTIPAHRSVAFTPGHAHLMLQNPTQTLKKGDTVNMTITFATAGTVTLILPVVPVTGPAVSTGNMTGMTG
jgi:copper(I)-binding protein